MCWIFLVCEFNVGPSCVAHIYRGKRETKDQRRALTLPLHVLPLLCKVSNIVIEPQAYSFSSPFILKFYIIWNIIPIRVCRYQILWLLVKVSRWTETWNISGQRGQIWVWVSHSLDKCLPSYLTYLFECAWVSIANDSDCANLLPKLEYVVSEMSTANLGNEREIALGKFPQFIWVIQTNKPYNEKNIQPVYLTNETSHSVKIDKVLGCSTYLKLLSIL